MLVTTLQVSYLWENMAVRPLHIQNSAKIRSLKMLWFLWNTWKITARMRTYSSQMNRKLTIWFNKVRYSTRLSRILSAMHVAISRILLITLIIRNLLRKTRKFSKLISLQKMGALLRNLAESSHLKMWILLPQRVTIQDLGICLRTDTSNHLKTLIFLSQNHHNLV